MATSFVQLPGGGKILFAPTHFDAEDNDTSRFLQVNKIAEILKEQASPVIIGGDFNAEPGTRVVNKLDSFTTRTCKQNCGSSFPEEGSSRLIDFIGYSPSKAFSVKKYQVINEKYASDHVPVISVLELNEIL